MKLIFLREGSNSDSIKPSKILMNIHSIIFRYVIKEEIFWSNLFMPKAQQAESNFPSSMRNWLIDEAKRDAVEVTFAEENERDEHENY